MNGPRHVIQNQFSSQPTFSFMIDRRVTRTAASYALEVPILDPAGPGKEASQLRRVNPSAAAIAFLRKKTT